jgi:hypothetical protein
METKLYTWKETLPVKNAPYFAAKDGYLESKKRSRLFSMNHTD